MFYFRNTFRNIELKRLFMSFYAVARGHNIGIYETWAQCAEQVKGFKGAQYKKFKTRTEAEAFVKQGNASSSSATKTSKTEPKDFWPEDNNDELATIDDSELLAACAKADLFAANVSATGTKRKVNDFDAAAGSKSKQKKKLTHVSNVWKPVGYEIINNLRFEIDAEGYVIVYTDGSCINNGGKNPCAGLGVYFGEDHPLNAALPVTGRVTNNVGEIQAAIYAIKKAKDVGIEKLCVSTDSQFLINSITIWVNAWKQNKWRLKNGEPVKNVIDFKELDKLLAEENMQVKWNYVKGHHSIVGNQKADKLAREGSDIYKRLHNVES